MSKEKSLDQKSDLEEILKSELFEQLDALGFDYGESDEKSEEAYLFLRDEYRGQKDNKDTSFGVSRSLVNSRYKLVVTSYPNVLEEIKHALKEKKLIGEDWKEFEFYKDRYKLLRVRRMLESVNEFIENPSLERSFHDHHYGAKFKLVFDGTYEQIQEENAK